MNSDRGMKGTETSGASMQQSRVLQLNTFLREETLTCDTETLAGAVALYGIPKAHITDTDYLSYVCIQINSGPCEIVDVQHAYLNTEHHDESVLLWQNDALDPSRSTDISIRLLKTSSGSMSVFPFKALHYYEPQEYST